MFLLCLWPNTAVWGKDAGGQVTAESLSLHHLAFSHRNPPCVGGELKSNLAERQEEAVGVLPEQFAQGDHCIYASWAEILVRGQTVSFSNISSQALLC